MTAPRIIYSISEQDYPPYGSLLVLNANGTGRLQMAISKDVSPPAGLYDGWLLLDGIPLVHWQQPDCPTCENLLLPCEGSPTEHAIWAERINGLTISDFEVGDGFGWTKCLAPVLGLLPSGIFQISVDNYYPTDGQGNLFWQSPSQGWTTAMSYHWSVNGNGDFPAFLIATQSTRCFRPASFAAARKTFRQHPGLAYYLSGRLSALLDGHHRALAAAELGAPFCA